MGKKHLKVTNDVVKKAGAMRRGGMSYAKIAAEFDLNTMTIYRALNGQTKNIEVQK